LYGGQLPGFLKAGRTSSSAETFAKLITTNSASRESDNLTETMAGIA